MLGLGIGLSSSEGVFDSYEPLVVTSQAATTVTSDKATLNGSYTGGGTILQAGFDISFSSDLSNSIVLNAKNLTNPFEYDYSPLIAGYDYYYRAFVVDNVVGKVQGSIVSFTAAGSPATLGSLTIPIFVYAPNWTPGTDVADNLDYWKRGYLSDAMEPNEVLASVSDEQATPETRENVLKVQNALGTNPALDSVVTQLAQSDYEGFTTNTFNTEDGVTYRFIFDMYIPTSNRVSNSANYIGIGFPFQEYAPIGSDYSSTHQGTWKTITKDLTMPNPHDSSNVDIRISIIDDNSAEQEDLFYLANLAIYKV